MNIKEIKSLEGLGEIRFGLNRNQVKQILGEPSEIDAFQFDEEEEDEITESWHYDEHELSFSFDEIEDWKLVNIAISSENYTLSDQVVIGLTKPQLLQFLSTLELGEINDDAENNVISVIESQINFWFENGEVLEVQWNVDWDEEGEAIFPE